MQEKDLKEKEICDCEEAEEKAEAVVEEETKEDTKKEDKKASKFSKKKKIEELEEEIIKLKIRVFKDKKIQLLVKKQLIGLPLLKANIE